MTRIERIKLLKELQAGNIKLKDLLPKGFTMKIGYGESVQFFVNDVAVNESSFFEFMIECKGTTKGLIDNMYKYTKQLK